MLFSVYPNVKYLTNSLRENWKNNFLLRAVFFQSDVGEGCWDAHLPLSCEMTCSYQLKISSILQQQQQQNKRWDKVEVVSSWCTTPWQKSWIRPCNCRDCLDNELPYFLIAESAFAYNLIFGWRWNGMVPDIFYPQYDSRVSGANQSYHKIKGHNQYFQDVQKQNR